MIKYGAKSKKMLNNANNCIMEHGKSATTKSKHMMDRRQQCKLDEIMLQDFPGVKPFDDDIKLDDSPMSQDFNADDYQCELEVDVGLENRFAPFLDFNAFKQKNDKASQFEKKVTEMIATCSAKEAMIKLRLIENKPGHYTTVSGMNHAELKDMVDKLMFRFCKAFVIAASSNQPRPIMDASSCSICGIPYHYKTFHVYCQCGFIFGAHVGLCTMELLKQTCPLCDTAICNTTPLTPDEWPALPSLRGSS